MTDKTINFHKYCDSLLYSPQASELVYKMGNFALQIAIVFNSNFVGVFLRRYLVGIIPLVYWMLKQCKTACANKQHYQVMQFILCLLPLITCCHTLSSQLCLLLNDQYTLWLSD